MWIPYHEQEVQVQWEIRTNTCLLQMQQCRPVVRYPRASHIYGRFQVVDWPKWLVFHFWQRSIDTGPSRHAHLTPWFIQRICSVHTGIETRWVYVVACNFPFWARLGWRDILKLETQIFLCNRTVHFQEPSYGYKTQAFHITRPWITKWYVVYSTCGMDREGDSEWTYV